MTRSGAPISIYTGLRCDLPECQISVRSLLVDHHTLTVSSPHPLGTPVPHLHRLTPPPCHPSGLFSRFRSVPVPQIGPTTPYSFSLVRLSLDLHSLRKVSSPRTRTNLCVLCIFLSTPYTTPTGLISGSTHTPSPSSGPTLFPYPGQCTPKRTVWFFHPGFSSKSLGQIYRLTKPVLKNRSWG